MAPLRLLIVTDLATFDEETTVRAVDCALEVARPGELAVGLRDHQEGVERRLSLGRRLVAILGARGGRLVVHDRLDLCLALGADGVQLGSRTVAVSDARRLLPPPALLGWSCHDEPQLAEAARAGADFATLSPLFDSPGKGQALGVERFGALRSTVPGLRVLALGGLSSGGAERARRAGADGVAVIRAVLGATDPAEAARALLAPFRR